MIEYEVRRKGSEHAITVSSPDSDGGEISRELATDVARILSRAWNCVLTLHRIDDMAWHLRDFSVLAATYDNGELVKKGTP